MKNLKLTISTALNDDEYHHEVEIEIEYGRTLRILLDKEDFTTEIYLDKERINISSDALSSFYVFHNDEFYDLEDLSLRAIDIINNQIRTGVYHTEEII